MSPLISELKRRSWADLIVCSTGQHREMLLQILAVFGIIPDIDLDVMIVGQSLSSLTSRVVEAMDKVLEEVKPDWVFVQGDTTTTFCAALAAFYHRIPVAHVEAGLRTDNRYSPFPEEINRRMVSALVTMHFAPTSRAAQALIREGYTENSVHVVGNTVIDALLHTRDYVLSRDYSASKEISEVAKKDRVVLVTGHRRENFGEGFERFCQALAKLSELYPNVCFVYPVHLNPNVQAPVRRNLEGHRNIYLTEPLDYPTFVWLMSRCYFVITDSGGIQEEAPSLGKPVVVTRDTTERMEAIESGVAKLVGTDVKAIVETASRLLEDPDFYSKMAMRDNPYGDGKAATRIADILEREERDDS